jgi:5-methyltetrahydrofolate--homocysteine methyltransferase
MRDAIRAASVLTVRDRDSKEFVKSHTKKKKKGGSLPPQKVGDQSHSVYKAIVDGNRQEIVSLVEQALQDGEDPLVLNQQILIPAIQEVGGQYDRKMIFLPQMILAAETMQDAFQVLEPHFKSSGLENRGTIIICTVKGDVHDIGKNIVGLFLKNQGYRIVDLGKDVPADTIVEKSIETNADIVALSALMTTTMVEMPEVIQRLRQTKLKTRVMVGGAVLTKRFAQEIGADGYAKDGISAIEVAHQLMAQS